MNRQEGKMLRMQRMALTRPKDTDPTYKSTIVAKVSRPKVLTIGQELLNVSLHGSKASCGFLASVTSRTSQQLAVQKTFVIYLGRFGKGDSLAKGANGLGNAGERAKAARLVQQKE